MIEFKKLLQVYQLMVRIWNLIAVSDRFSLIKKDLTVS